MQSIIQKSYVLRVCIHKPLGLDREKSAERGDESAPSTLKQIFSIFGLHFEPLKSQGYPLHGQQLIQHQGIVVSCT